MPRLEEITDQDLEDIDNMDFDPAEFDPRNPFAKSNPSDSRAANLVPVESAEASSSSQKPMPQIPQQQVGGHPFISRKEDMEQFKSWQVIYPVYFDASKSHSEGRRVPKETAVENPLADTIIEACKAIGIHCVYEADKTHPKDWANPGRVRVLIRDDGNALPPAIQIKNKRHLYKIIGEYMKKHPTTERKPFEGPVAAQMKRTPGMDLPEKASPLAVPKGWNLSTVLPLNSRAMTGGEQNEQMLKQMQDRMFPGLNVPDVKPKKMKIRAPR
ncbi:signal recognition particle subunit Sec65p [Trichomonascus vanleenenianus]|uniref:RNA-binding signal recognition particle subunit SEC65 n=1 Tax=Trichomonascus vanleenenianus TaxID=2268995 RepID=UPI003ECAD21E